LAHFFCGEDNFSYSIDVYVPIQLKKRDRNIAEEAEKPWHGSIPSAFIKMKDT